MRGNSSVISWLKLYMIFTKGAHQSTKCQENFNCFGRLLLLKVYTISAKKSAEELFIMILKIDAKFEQKTICCFKIDENLMNFDPSTQKPPKFAI